MNEYIVIKYYVRSRLKGLGTAVAYGKVTVAKTSKSCRTSKPLSAKITPLSKHEAMALIEKDGLKVALRNEEGIVWDNGEFLEKYKDKVYVYDL